MKISIQTLTTDYVKNVMNHLLELNVQKCGEKTSVIYVCRICRANLETSFCKKCKKEANAYSYKQFPLKPKLFSAQEKVGIRVKEPFKGVKELINQDRIAEPLEKGIIRQNFDLTVFKDGTVRFDATNSPLTHFQTNLGLAHQSKNYKN